MFRVDVFRIALATVNKTQKQVAQECGVHETTITRVKKGLDVKVSLAMKIAKVVDKKVDELWDLDK